MKLISLFFIILCGVATYFIINKIIEKNRINCIGKKCNFNNEVTICMSTNSIEERNKCLIKVKNDENECIKHKC